MSSSRYYNQLVQRIEYNPRLFLILLIWACVVVFAHQFASMLTAQWMTAALATVAMLAAVAILIWPFQAVMIFLIGVGAISSFLRGGTMMGLGGALVYPIDLFVAAFFVIEFFRGCTRQTRLYSTTDRWVLAFFVWSLVCIARGLPEYKHSAYGEAREFAGAIAYFITIHYVTRPEQIPSVLKWLKWCSFISCILYFQHFIQASFSTRFAGGRLGLYVVCTVIALAVLLGRDHIKRYRTLAVWLLIVLTALVLYSAARGLVVSMLVTFPFLLWITRRHFIKTSIVGLIVVISALCLVVFMDPVFGGQLVPYMKKAYHGILSPSEDPTGGWRLYGWEWEMKKIFSNPFWVLIGQGYGGYYEWFFSNFDEVIHTGPHNHYIQIWSKMGLVGLGLFGAAFFSFYVQAFRFLQRSRNDLHRSVIMIFMLWALANLTDMIPGEFAPSIWVVLALGTALPRLWLQMESESRTAGEILRMPSRDTLRNPSRRIPGATTGLAMRLRP